MSDTSSDPNRPTPDESPRILWPEAKRDESYSSTHHGQQVIEPYHYFKDRSDPNLNAFVNEEKYRSDKFFASPELPRIKAKLETMNQYPRISNLMFRGADKRFYFLFERGIWGQMAVYSCTDLSVLNDRHPEEKMQLVHNPNDVGKYTSVCYLSLSRSQELLAIGEVDRDSDDMSITVKNLDTGEFVGGKVKNLKKYHQIEWAKEEKGFFYWKHKPTAEGAQAKLAKIVCLGNFFHSFESDKEDVPVSHKTVTKSRETLSHEESCVGESIMLLSMQSARENGEGIAHNSESVQGGSTHSVDIGLEDAKEIDTEEEVGSDEDRVLMAIRIKDNDKPNYLSQRVGKNYSLIGHNVNTFYLMTVDGAPMGRVDHAIVSDEGLIEITDLIPQSKSRKLQSCRQLLNMVLVCNYLDEGSDSLHFFHVVGDCADLIKILHPPDKEPVTLFSFTLQRNSSTFLYAYQSPISPCTVVEVRIVLVDQSSSSAKRSKYVPQVEHNVIFQSVVPGIDRNRFKVSRRKYRSKTYKVPAIDSASSTSTPDTASASDESEEIVIFITEKLDENGQEQKITRSCIAHAYGGFNTPTRPTFNLRNAYFINEFNGVCALVQPRGGSERGPEWHKAALREKKQQTFDDFKRGIDSLIEWGYTTNDKIAIAGSSFGGLLMAVTSFQNPSLIKAAIINAAPLDMWNYPEFGVGWQWQKEFGDIKNVSEFKAIMKWWFKLHSIDVPECGFPAMLILAAEGDFRVQVIQSFKFAAELYHALNKRPELQTNPVFMKIFENEMGHGHLLNTDQKVELNAHQIFFIAKALGLTLSDDDE